MAANSPDLVNNWNYGSGLFLGGAAFTTNNIDFHLSDLPGGQTFTAALTSFRRHRMLVSNGNLLVGSQAAGQLIQTVNSKGIIFSNLTLGSGAAGHVFTGVAAGANPNNLWHYDTNVTSA